jgi:hypothetical protein
MTFANDCNNITTSTSTILTNMHQQYENKMMKAIQTINQTFDSEKEMSA